MAHRLWLLTTALFTSSAVSCPVVVPTTNFDRFPVAEAAKQTFSNAVLVAEVEALGISEPDGRLFVLNALKVIRVFKGAVKPGSFVKTDRQALVCGPFLSQRERGIVAIESLAGKSVPFPGWISPSQLTWLRRSGLIR